MLNMRESRILVVDDDPDVLTAIRLLLKQQVKEVITEKNPERLPDLLQKEPIDLVLLDMNFNASIHSGNEGLFWMKKIRSLRPELPVILITAYADIDLAIQSLKEGAADFLVKPWQNQQLTDTIRELLQKTGHRNTTTTAARPPLEGIIGQSEKMTDILKKVSKVAPTDANVFILGENGTGKDLIAEAIHRLSRRSGKSLVKVDVGALSEGLFESELFGHKKGAFTDAREDREGRFEMAHEGTLFMDEIGNITLQQQARLLTVLQSRQVTRIGTNKPITVDFRLICATNMRHSDLADERRFRKDLIYRINTVEIILPPLRERKEDIPLLTAHFLNYYCSKYFKNTIALSDAAMKKLQAYHFPGNIRELQYIIERGVIMADGDTLEADDLLFSPLENGNPTADEGNNLSELEKQTILRVIEKHNGNISKAARELGLTRTALYRRISKYEI